jgi:hypothetical protein
MATTTQGRVAFPVYRIERDDFDGRLKITLSFGRHPGSITRQRDGLTGLITADVMDGGPAGTLTAPAGTRLIELEDGTTAIRLPEGTILGAREAVQAAKTANRAHSFGLGFSAAQ